MASADARATFTLGLEDQTSGPAASAAKALQTLRGQIDADTKALASMQRAMKNLQQGSVVNVAQFKDLKARIEAKKQAVADAQASFLSLGGSFTRSASAGKGASNAFTALREQIRSMGGPLAQTEGRFAGLVKLLRGGALTLGLVAVTAALVALAAAAVAAGLALAKYGIATADARRNELLHIESLTKMRNWWGLAAGNATEMQTAIDRVSGSVAIGRGKIAQYSEQLYKMGLRGENLSQALEGVAIKASTQGDAAAGAFAGWAAGAAMAGGSVKKLTDDVRARLGGIAAKQLLSLGTQSEKLHESWAALFSGLKIEAFLKSLRSVTELFAQSTASGRALKATLTNLTQPIVNAFTAAGPLARRFFQGMILASLDLQIAYYKLKIRMKETFGDLSLFKGLDLSTGALTAGKVALYGLAAGLGIVSLAFGLLATSIAGPFALLYGFGRLLVSFGELLGGVAYDIVHGFEIIFGTLGELLGDYLYDLVNKDWASAGKAVVSGIAAGIQGHAQVVIDEVKNLGASIWQAFRSKLGIASPSKAFAKLGLALPQGVQAGVKAGTPAVRSTVAAMVPAPSPEAPSGASASRGARGGKSVTVTIGDVYVQTAPGANASQVAADFRSELTRVLEGLAIQLGAPVPGGV